MYMLTMEVLLEDLHLKMKWYGAAGDSVSVWGESYQFFPL